MSGWRRLWIVLSILLGVPSGIAAYAGSGHASASVPYNGNNDQFWQAAQKVPALSDCDWPTAKALFPMDHAWYVSCDTRDPFRWVIFWALVPAAIMAAIGLTIRWIYRGFRHPGA